MGEFLAQLHVFNKIRPHLSVLTRVGNRKQPEFESKAIGHICLQNQWILTEVRKPAE